MSKEKQIEEMALALSNLIMFSIPHSRVIAAELYDEGYRKQSDGEWITKHTPLFKPNELVCSNCQSLNGTRIKFNYCPNCGAKMKGE